MTSQGLIKLRNGMTAIFSSMVISIAGLITGLIIKSRDTIRAAAHTVYKGGEMLVKLAAGMGKILEPVLKVLSKVLSWIRDLLGWISENLWVVPIIIVILPLGNIKNL